MLTQGGDAVLRLLHTAASFKRKRLGDDADGQDSEIAGNLGHDRRRSRAGAAAHAGGNEHHIGALKRGGNFLAALFRGALPFFRVCARTHAVGELLADLDLLRGLGTVERLAVGVDGDEFHALHSGNHHAVDRVAAATADSDHLYLNTVHEFIVKLKAHETSSHAFIVPAGLPDAASMFRHLVYVAKCSKYTFFILTRPSLKFNRNLQFFIG